MRIIFEEEGTGHRIILDADWTCAKKVLDEFYRNMTIGTFERTIREEPEDA